MAQNIHTMVFQNFIKPDRALKHEDLMYNAKTTFDSF